MKDIFPYEDIVGIERHISKNHPEIPVSDRAARFSPFAAISGYEDMVKEAARVTEKRIELDENAIELLNEKLQMILEFIDEKPSVSVTYFEPDKKKEGGSYLTAAGRVIMIDDYSRTLVLQMSEQEQRKIVIDDIYDITGDLFYSLGLD